MLEVSVMFPVYIPSPRHKEMTDANLLIAKAYVQDADVEWIIVETESQYYLNDADVYIYEKMRTTPNISMNRGFSAARGKFVIFLANDVKVCNNWVEKMLECFKKHSDCGLASLGNNEHNDPIDDVIVEEGQRFFFSVSMMRREDAWYDPQYTFIFDDTDLIYRLHLKGKKYYKNLSGHIYHPPHTTLGPAGGNIEEYKKCRNIFKEKYKAHAADPLYQLFVGLDI